MITNKKIEIIIRCFKEIEEFSLSRNTQSKIILALKKRNDEKNKLIEENRRLKNMIVNKDSEAIEQTREFYQTITLVLGDGTKHKFTGKAISKDPNYNIKIDDIIISSPVQLPPSLKFESI